MAGYYLLFMKKAGIHIYSVPVELHAFGNEPFFLSFRASEGIMSAETAVRMYYTVARNGFRVSIRMQGIAGCPGGTRMAGSGRHLAICRHLAPWDGSNCCEYVAAEPHQSCTIFHLSRQTPSLKS